MNESIARNIRVQDRYDELMRIGRHGHYETMFQVVREEIESLRQQLELKHEECISFYNEAETVIKQRDEARQQLAASQKREVTLRKLIGEIYCSDDSSAEVTRKIEDVLSAMGNSYSKESTQGFEDWHSSHAKYMEPADIIHWCRDAYNAGVIAVQTELNAERNRRFEGNRISSQEYNDCQKQLAAALDDLEVAKNVANGNVEAKFDAWKQLDAMEHELAAALAACKVKDEALSKIEYLEADNGCILSAGECSSIATEALAIQPDDSALKAWLGEPLLCREDGRCQYAIDHGAEGTGHCPEGKCCMPLYRAWEPK